MTMTTQSGISRAPRPSSLADVLDLILDKGLVIDAYVRVSLVGIEILTIDLRVVVASVDTYLRFAEAVNRLDLTATSESKGLPELFKAATTRMDAAVIAIARAAADHSVAVIARRSSDLGGANGRRLAGTTAANRTTTKTAAFSRKWSSGVGGDERERHPDAESGGSTMARKRVKQELNGVDHAAGAILALGALNWGLVGAANFDAVRATFGRGVASRAVYGLVASSAVYAMARGRQLANR